MYRLPACIPFGICTAAATYYLQRWLHITGLVWITHPQVIRSYRMSIECHGIECHVYIECHSPFCNQHRPKRLQVQGLNFENLRIKFENSGAISEWNLEELTLSLDAPKWIGPFRMVSSDCNTTTNLTCTSNYMPHELVLLKQSVYA